MAELVNDFSVVFDNKDLNTIDYVHFTRRQPNNEADIEVTSHQLVRRDGRVITSVRRDDKMIPFEGYIVAPNRVAYEEALDELKYFTSGVERPLVIQQGGESRRYTVTKANLIVDHIEAGKARISLAFVASNPYAQSSNLTTFTLANSTTSPAQIVHEFGGTANARPTVVITVNSGTDMANKYIGIGNSSTGQQVQVIRDWVAGDVVRFNFDRLDVYVNDVLSDYSGVFAEFQARKSHAYYYDNFTARDVSVEMYYANRYQ